MKIAYRLLIAFASLSSLFLLSSAYALSGSDFQPGRITDDTVFFDSGSMSVSQIQSFLSSHVPTCDSSGSQVFTGYYKSSTAFHPTVLQADGTYSYPNGYTYTTSDNVKRYQLDTAKPAPYTCLKDYLENPTTHDNNIGRPTYQPAGGISAAQIIYNSATDPNNVVSPKSLLVLIQKESSLITDDWPWPNEYKTATGYACPDTSGCDTNYYGFYNQVYSAAHQFRYYANHPTGYRYVLGNNNILYNPNSGCGTKAVNIQNQATLGLYIYTPYTPNQAALDNLYGYGDTCSAYGNRNFWRLFNDWFGTSLGTSILRTPDSPTLYLLWSGVVYPIPSGDVLNAWGFGSTPITVVSNTYLTSITHGPLLSRVARFGGDPTIRLVDGTHANGFPDASTYNSYGYTLNSSETVYDGSLLAALNPGTVMTSLNRSSLGAVYLMQNGRKRVFPDAETFSTLGSPAYSSQPIVALTNIYTSALPDGAPLLLNGKVFKQNDGPTIYMYEGDKAMPFSYNSYNGWGLPTPNYSIASFNINQLTAGTTMPTLAQNSSGVNLLIDRGAIHAFDANTQTTWGLSSGSFTPLSAASLGRLTQGSAITNVVKGDSPAVFFIQSGKANPFASASDLYGYGYNFDGVTNISQMVLSTFGAGVLTYKPTSLLDLPSGTIVMSDSDYTYHAIPDISTFNELGLSFGSVRNVADLNGYTSATNMTPILTNNGTTYLYDLGVLRAFSSAQFGASGYNLASRTSIAVTARFVANIPTGTDVTSYVIGSSQTVYVVKNGVKQPFTSGASFDAYGGVRSQIIKLSDQFLATIPTGSQI